MKTCSDDVTTIYYQIRIFLSKVFVYSIVLWNAINTNYVRCGHEDEGASKMSVYFSVRGDGITAKGVRQRRIFCHIGVNEPVA